MRRAFLNRVSEMIKNEEDTVFMTVDIGMWAIRDVLAAYPERCMNVGIYEDGMFGFAAGMASRGLVPTIFGIQPYLIERALEQIKMDFAYQGYGVNVVGTGAAVDYSKYGYSHYCAEDVGILKMIPGVEFMAPGTSRQFMQLFHQTYRNGRPTFFRISDYPNKNSDLDVNVEYGKANVIKKGSKATVVAVSVMLDAVWEACRDEDVTILYYTTLEPFDYDTLKENCLSKKVLICEPEYEGSLIYDVLKPFMGEEIRIKNVAFPREIFRNYGTYKDKMQYYGMTSKNIKKEIQLLIGMS